MIDGRKWDRGVAPDAKVFDALSDDLNTHEAMARLYQLADEARSNESALDIFVSSAQLLGILLSETHFSGEGEKVAFDGAKIDTLISARLAARAAKDWKESDRIRDELAAMGIAIMDNKDGTTSWEVKR
jgi:cysteinyl-tRNA synthetase